VFAFVWLCIDHFSRCVLQYARALELAAPFNKLVEAISQEPEWLLETLASVEASGQDEFTSRLMALQVKLLMLHQFGKHLTNESVSSVPSVKFSSEVASSSGFIWASTGAITCST
jgi:hypothetical protein